MRKLIALILISTQAFAGLPPTTTKGQSDASAKVKFQFQAPHNQFTNLGGISTLIETGNGNILPDPGFEASVSGWTASGGATATANSTAKGTGAKGYDWDSNSAGQTLTSSSVTIPAGLAGKNGIASCNIKTVSGTATHTFTVNDGTNDIVTPITIQSSTTAFLGSNEGNKINFVFPAAGTTIRIKLASVNSDEPEIYLDDCSIQLANNVYDAPLVTRVIDETSLFTFTGIGSPGATKVYTNRIGDKLHVEGFVTSGTPSASTFSINLPSKYIIDYTKLTTTSNVQKVGNCSLNASATTAFVNATSGVTHVFTDGSTTGSVFVTFQYTGNGYNKVTGTSFFSSGNTLSFSFDIPISGWSAVSAVSADQTDYGDTTYTLTSSNTQGIGTPTGECQHARVSDKLKIRCKVTNGTTTASEMRINLPNSLTSADTTRIPTIQLAGYATFASANTNQFQVYIEPSVQYLTFGFQGTASGLTKQTGSAEFGTGAVYSFSAEVPIQGWSSNQRAPTLVGSVTSNSTSALRSEYVKFGTTSSSVCSASPCAYTRSSSAWFTNVTRSSVGFYTVNVPSGTFSDIPVCTCSVGSSGNTARHCFFNDRESLTAIPMAISNSAGSAVDGEVSVNCIGPR